MHLTPTRADAIASADVIVTVTGAEGVLRVADVPLLKHDVTLANAGHFPIEIDVSGIEDSDLVEGRTEYEADITTWHFCDGRAVHLLGRGHMVNLAGPRPLGNSIASMDIGFTLQARCLEAVSKREVGDDAWVIPVPTEIDVRVAEAYLQAVRDQSSVIESRSR